MAGIWSAIWLVFCALAAGCGNGTETAASLPPGTALPSGCPATGGSAQGKIDETLDSAWQAADPELRVRVLVETTEQPTIQEHAGTDSPSPQQRAVFEDYVRNNVQRCSAALIEALGGELQGQFAVSGSAVLARLTRSQGLAVAAYSEVAQIKPAGALPPPAGSEECADLSQAGCETRADCRIIEGIVWQTEAECGVGPFPVGCVASDISTAENPRWLQTPTGQCVYLTSLATPEGWSIANTCDAPNGAPPLCSSGQ